LAPHKIAVRHLFQMTILYCGTISGLYCSH